MAATLPPGADTWTEFDRDLYEMRVSWLEAARPNQIAPPAPWRVWLLQAGRGFGKTRTAAEEVAYQALSNRDHRIAVLAPTFAAMRDVCFEGQSGVLKWIPDKYVVKWNRSIGELFLSNGTLLRGFGAEEPDRLRGPEFNLSWADELAAMERQDEIWMNLELCTRLKPWPRIIVTTTPRPTATIRALVARSTRRLKVDQDNKADFRTVAADKVEDGKIKNPYIYARAS